MAVIKQTQQFRNQRIGVVKASTGEQQLWQQVGQAADNLVRDVMVAARPKAQQMGEEAAQKVAQEGLLRTIDPATGRAEAFTPPPSLGSIAQQAYRETMRRRYVRSAESEIKNKASELFIKYQNDPQGPDKYSVAMQDYVEQMVKTTDSTFAETIKEVGANYLASTKLNLMQKRAAAVANMEQLELEKDSNQFAVSVSDFGNDTQSLMLAYEQEEIAQRQALEAGIQSEDQYQANMIRMRRAVQQNNIAGSLVYGAMVDDIDPADGVSRTKARPIRTQDFNNLEALYQSGGDKRIYDQLPQGLKDIYDRSVMLGNETMADFDELRKAVSLANSRFEADKANASANVKDVSDFVRISAGGGDSGSKPDRKAVDSYVFGAAGVESIVDQVNYYTTTDSLTDPNVELAVTKLNVPPQTLVLNLQQLASGRDFTPEQTQNLMQHYLRFSNHIDSKGNNQNKLNDVLSDEEIGILESAAYISNFYGGSAALPQILSNIVSNRQDEDAYQAKLNRMFSGQTGKMQNLGSYLADKFENNAMMVKRYKPFAEYMIANGGSLADIDDHLNKMVNSVYIDTNNLVADVLYSNSIDKSMFSLDRTIPNQMGQDLFIMSVNRDLPDGYHFGTTSKEGHKQVYLVPQDLRGTGIKGERGTMGVIYNAFYKDEFGMLSPVPAKNKKGDPLFLTFDPAMFMKSIANRLPQEENINTGGATQDEQEIRSFKGKIGTGLLPLGTTLDEQIDATAIGGFQP